MLLITAQNIINNKVISS